MRSPTSRLTTARQLVHAPGSDPRFRRDTAQHALADRTQDTYPEVVICLLRRILEGIQILDCHIVLSRVLQEAIAFPTLDMLPQDAITFQDCGSGRWAAEGPGRFGGVIRQRESRRSGSIPWDASLSEPHGPAVGDRSLIADLEL